jgi:hypothetical protein
MWPAVRPLLERALCLEGEERQRFVERAAFINEAVYTVLVHLVRAHEELLESELLATADLAGGRGIRVH